MIDAFHFDFGKSYGWKKDRTQKSV